MTAPILRTSERRAFKSCQAKWWWGYREGLKPVGSERTPLWFGTGFHLSLAEWYIPGVKRGIHPSETWERYAKDSLHAVKVADATDETVAAYEDGAKLGEILTAEYVRYYGRDDSWDFIQAEQTFSLDVPWPKEPERQGMYVVDDDTGLLVAYKGTYDGVYRDLVDGKIKLLETKTARAVQTSHLTLDDQAGSYWAVATRTLRAMGKIGVNERIHGITYNFIRKGLPDERPRDAEGYACNKPVKADYIAALAPGAAQQPAQLAKLTTAQMQTEAEVRGITVLGERSKVQPAPLFVRVPVWRTGAEQRSQLLRIQDEAVHMQAVRDGILPITKNPTRDCGFCDYFQMCELQERGGEWEEFKRIAFRVEDPYADHRKSSDE